MCWREKLQHELLPGMASEKLVSAGWFLNATASGEAAAEACPQLPDTNPWESSSHWFLTTASQYNIFSSYEVASFDQ